MKDELNRHGMWRVNGLEVRELDASIAGPLGPIALQRQTFAVLACLLRDAGNVVRNEVIIETAWGRANAATAEALKSHVRKIRLALGDDDCIRSVRKIGYQFVAAVDTIDDSGVEPELPRWIPGEAIPGHPQCTLLEQWDSDASHEIWMCRREETGARMLLRRLTDPDRLDCFEREIECSRQLSEMLPESDKFALLTGANITAPPYFLASAYHGPNLVDWARERGGLHNIPIDERIEIVAQLAEAVAEAHAVVVLHGNLLPTSIYVGAGQVRIGAFGTHDPYRPNPIPFYTAPELRPGTSVTTRSDIYSIGVIAYQVLAGSFESALSPGWDNDIADDLLRTDIAAATAGNPDRRLPSAQEFAKRLRDLNARRDDQQRQVAAEAAQRELDRTRRWRKRFTIAASLAIVAVGAIVGLIVSVADRSLAQSRVTAALERYVTADIFSQDDPVFLEGGPLASFLDPSAELTRPGVSSLAAHRYIAEGKRKELGADSPSTLSAELDLVNSLLMLGRGPEARDVMSTDVGPYLSRMAHPDEALSFRARYSEAMLAKNEGHTSEAVSLYKQLWNDCAGQDWSALKGLDRQFPTKVGFRLVQSLYADRNYADAETTARALVTEVGARNGTDSMDFDAARTLLGAVQIRTGKLVEAEDNLMSANQKLPAAVGQEGLALLINLHYLADLRFAQGREDKGVEILADLANRTEHLFGPGAEPTVLARIQLAHAQIHMGRFHEALQISGRVTQDLAWPGDSASTTFLAARVTQAQALLGLQRDSEAVPLIEDLDRIDEQSPVADRTLHAFILLLRAQVERANHNDDTASQLSRKANDLLIQQLGANSPDAADAKHLEHLSANEAMPLSMPAALHTTARRVLVRQSTRLSSLR